jgi:hypothetical protein
MPQSRESLETGYHAAVGRIVKNSSAGGRKGGKRQKGIKSA